MRQTILLLFLLILLFFQACLPGDEEIFVAGDEIHSIVLFDNGNKFEMIYNGLNSVEGIYSLSGDTIYLTYDDNQTRDFDPNILLSRKLVVDSAGRVLSGDARKSFCANVELDKRKKN